jgi:hypothetical protein
VSCGIGELRQQRDNAAEAQRDFARLLNLLNPVFGSRARRGY